MNSVCLQPNRATSFKPLAPLVSCAVLLTALASASSAAMGQDAVSIGVIHPKTQPLTRTLVLPADARPYEKAELFAKISGYVKAVHVEIGQAVPAGDALAEIDVPEMVQELSQVQAERVRDNASLQKFKTQARLQRLNFERSKRLYEKKALTQAEFETTQAEFEASQAEVKLAKAECDFTDSKIARLRTLMRYRSITAPFDGTITERNVDPGDFVRSAAENSGPHLFTIARSDKLRIQIRVPESDCAYIKPGKTKATLQYRSLHRPIQKTVVTRIASAVDPKTRTMLTEIEIENAHHTIIPGMYVIAELTLFEKPAALLVPSEVTRTDGAIQFVWIVQANQVQKQPINLGYDDGETAEILEGLSENSLVVNWSGTGLRQGMKVNPLTQEW